MTHTEYSWMTSEELLAFVYNLEDPPPLVTELAARLTIALDELEDVNDS